jgi:flagellar basal body-associated protein FliL
MKTDYSTILHEVEVRENNRRNSRSRGIMPESMMMMMMIIIMIVRVMVVVKMMIMMVMMTMNKNGNMAY